MAHSLITDGFGVNVAQQLVLDGFHVDVIRVPSMCLTFVWKDDLLSIPLTSDGSLSVPLGADSELAAVCPLDSTASAVLSDGAVTAECTEGSFTVREGVCDD